jgi:hypothetical protein
MTDDFALRLQRRDMARLIGRLQTSEARTERECLGLHAALVEAIRRLKVGEHQTADLEQALAAPASAPLAWRTRTQDLSTAERSALFDHIFREAAD